ncbi:alpha/beta fold hydrolase [Microbacterium sp.]|uniref:alpha/beta fold hydrolase n=1 Tax=Microbacterium sp. TaxID=51671 RepID=UPI003567B008
MDAKEHIVTMPNGRRLAGSSYGPENGRPVLFVAGAATGRAMRFGERDLMTRGIRLLTLDRPGMGSSSEDEGRNIQTTAEDYRFFVHSVAGRAAAALPVVANSQGSVFGLGAAIAGLSSRLILVSPADEVAHPRIREMLPPHAAALVDLVAKDPMAATGELSRFTPQAMEEMVVGGASDRDRRVYQSPDFIDMYRRSLDEGFANRGVGYVRDTLIAMRPWGLPLADITCPVDILVGEADFGHSPDLAETLATRIPTATRKLIANAGGALLWEHADTVFRHALKE